MRKVYVKQERRAGERKWYKGEVIGTQSFIRQTMSIFDGPPKEYSEDKLLVRMSNGQRITVWKSETYDEVKR